MAAAVAHEATNQREPSETGHSQKAPKSAPSCGRPRAPKRANRAHPTEPRPNNGKTTRETSLRTRQDRGAPGVAGRRVMRTPYSVAGILPSTVCFREFPRKVMRAHTY